MPDKQPNPELMRALGRLVRGLSALFWGLPTALLVCFYTARPEGSKDFGIVPPLAATAVLVFGIWQLGAFQPQERVWRFALDRARLFALLTFGLSPFLYWWSRLPSSTFFTVMLVCLAVSALAMLTSLNLLLQRLAAMLPDETLRLEVRQFTALNLNLLGATAILGVAFAILGQVKTLPEKLQRFVFLFDRGSLWFLVLVFLLPLAMTMALLWKTKEVILDSIFAEKQ